MRRLAAAVLSTGVFLLFISPAGAVDIDDALELYRTGQYDECASMAAGAIEEKSASESWRLLKIRCELVRGKYRQALETLEAALRRHPTSIQLRMLGHEVYRYNDQPERAVAIFDAMESLVRATPWRYRDAANRVTLGRFLLRRGSDARQVLEMIYDPLRKEQPDFVDTYVASAELALEKQDFALAAAELGRALKRTPDDPDTLYLLARAHAPGEPPRSKEYLARALERNPRHVDSLLMSADNLIDAEDYSTAGAVLDRVAEINAAHPLAWAYRAVLAHLRGDVEGERSARKMALLPWSKNPGVDHLIGRKLSQKYRFADGAACQRRALAIDADYLPATMQLCQDLLRLGEEEEGWRLAEEVYEEDGYNVVAHNLGILRERLDGFRTLRGDGLLVRMDGREAEIYGHRVLDLLQRARQEMCAKYEVELREPVIVEIFPEQKDFAIRTFGLPGGEGFLGVCFGRVVTANSPAAQGDSPSNLEAVLWHEFCHVITLRKTRNKMPRWLSEGISVHEEKLARRSWGQDMNPRYREMILADEATPVSRLSAAFLSPPSPLHLQFAYYEASLVVEYLIENHGLDSLKRILSDLAEGVLINDALARHTTSLEDLDEKVAEFLRSRALGLAPGAGWERPDLPDDADLDAVAAWNRENPDNFWGLKRHAVELLKEKKWQEAKKPLKRFLRLYPGDAGDDSAYRLLAAVHRQLAEPRKERRVLEKLAALDGDGTDAYTRLTDLCLEARDWKGLARNAERLLAVQPIVEAPHRSLARAAEELGDRSRAIRAYRSLLVMEPFDATELHYRLARLLNEEGDLEGARRQVLRALEEAPRYRAAHRLLLEVRRRIEESGVKTGSAGGSEKPDGPGKPGAKSREKTS